MLIDDANLIDQVNPFLPEMPGTWSKPYGFSDASGTDKDEPAQWELSDESPACEDSLTGSDNQMQWCDPGKPNCPMRRALEPTQRVSPDITYPEDPALAIEPVRPPVPVAAPVKKSENYLYLIVLLILLFIASAAF
jgi:hypothetical protein